MPNLFGDRLTGGGNVRRRRGGFWGGSRAGAVAWSAVGHGAVGDRTVSRGVVLLRARGPISAPFPAPARQPVHAVLPHTAYRRRSPPAFGTTRQARNVLGTTTVP